MSLHPIINKLTAFIHTYENLTARQVVCLALLESDPSISIKEASATLQLPKPAMTRCYDVLISLGFVTSVRDKHDKRRVILNLTRSGQIMLNSCRTGDQLWETKTPGYFREASWLKKGDMITISANDGGTIRYIVEVDPIVTLSLD